MTGQVDMRLTLLNQARSREEMATTERKLAGRYAGYAAQDGRTETERRAYQAERDAALDRADTHDWTALSLRQGAEALEMLQGLSRNMDLPWAVRWDAQAVLRGRERPSVTVTKFHEALRRAQVSLEQAAERMRAATEASQSRLRFTRPEGEEPFVREVRVETPAGVAGLRIVADPRGVDWEAVREVQITEGMDPWPCHPREPARPYDRDAAIRACAAEGPLHDYLRPEQERRR